jgi:hypothetical protein
MVSTADMLRAEGRQEGRLEARRESLLELLEIKFGSIDSATRARVEHAFDTQVVVWMRRIVVVDTMEELFTPRHWSEVFVNTADELRAEVRLEGRLEALRESLLELLEIKFGPVDPGVRARVEQASNEEVVAWLRRVVVVSTHVAVFES